MCFGWKCMKHLNFFLELIVCYMFKKIKKRERIVKYIRSNSWFEVYQADTVKFDNRITHNYAYTFLLTIANHFS